MCIAVFCPKGKRLTQEAFFECWYSNDDGGGFMYAHEGALKIVREINDPMRLWKEYQNALKVAYSPFVLHFRIATSGKVNLKNCHPFRINEGLAVCHNGIIDIKIKSKALSDTVHFTKLLRRLPPNFLHKWEYKELIAGYCAGSKLVFMSGAGEVEIINECLGLWDSGVWFSNNSYKPATAYSQLSGAKYAYYDRDTISEPFEFDEGSDLDELCAQCFEPLREREHRVCAVCKLPHSIR